ncbi:hypothetical protein Rhal01_03713 [Rubritalea halochordaticola]|uniref:Uncharacterized protein n=1 Tax=Rubritalea halochordaticola TaxID=714537 RepID=A0ABP9V4D2_9BACT
MVPFSIYLLMNIEEPYDRPDYIWGGVAIMILIRFFMDLYPALKRKNTITPQS